MGFRRPKKAIGIDIGSYSAKAVLMSRFGGRLRVDGAVQVLVDRNILEYLHYETVIFAIGHLLERVREEMERK